jgi:hypothetical protein
MNADVIAAQQNPLAQEWLCLQQQHDRHEQQALLIKVAAVLAGLALAAWSNQLLFAMVAVALFWGQEAIVRTVQSRLALRLRRLEAAIAGESVERPFQLHRDWHASRGNAVGLLLEYAYQAYKPTVLYPYAVMLIGLLVYWVGQGR